MRIGFTGTQTGMSAAQQRGLVRILCSLDGEEHEFHHGDCIGADADAHVIVRRLDIPIHVHPPEIGSKRAYCTDAVATAEPKPYLVRNREIVDACDLLIAAPAGPEHTRSGTWSTVRYARRVHRPTIILDR